MRAKHPRRRHRLSPLHIEALEDRRLLTTYGITDLGNVYPIALKNNGDVAAEATVSGQTSGVLIKANGTVTDLSGLTLVGGLNDSDQVVGTNSSGSGALWNNGTVTPVPVRPGVVIQENGIAISDNGIIVGDTQEAEVNTNGTVTALTPPSTMMDAATISSNGQYVGGAMFGGQGETEAAMWNLATGQGKFVDDGSGSLGQTLGVNNSGDAVGIYDQDIGGSAFLYSNGKFMDLGEGNNSSANAINDQGVVVGTTGTGAVFIYSNGVSTNLQQEVPSGSGLTLNNAVGINDNGQVLATATDAAGNQHAVLLTPTPSVSMTLSGFPSTTTAGQAGNVTVTVLNPDGSVDTGYTGTVHFTSSDPQAVLPANYTFTPADAGVNTFGVTLKTAGAQSFTVTDTKTNTLFATDHVTVNPGAATHFAVLVGGTSTPAGEQFYILVEALDAYGNLATGFTGTVHVSSSDRRASLPANYTFPGGANGDGFAYLPITLRTLGKQTITVTDTSNPSISGSATINVVR
jgi:hypothetical protein